MNKKLFKKKITNQKQSLQFL